MKYIIEIEEEPLWRQSALYGENAVFKAKNFNALVFDKEGLDKLTPLNNELEGAYQKGYDEAKLIYQNPNAESDYQRGLDDAWEAITKIAKMPDGERMTHFGEVWISNILNAYSLDQIFTILKKSEFEPDEIKVSNVITDGKCNYLVIDITDKSYIALQGTDFEPVYIGKDYIKYYHNLHDSKDMTKIAEEINRAMKSEQRDCHTCKHPSSIECVDCRSFGRWQPKEGAE